MNWSRETDSAAATEAAGAELAAELESGDVITLTGDLGAGKTTLVRGAARALGHAGPVASPTFTIGRVYEGRMPEQVAIAHLDLYRLTGFADEDPGLLDDYLDPAMIVFIEWPSMAGEMLAELREAGRRMFNLEMTHAGGDRRQIAVSSG